jgi:hypothetical protein
VKLAIIDAAFEACAMHGEAGTGDGARVQPELTPPSGT